MSRGKLVALVVAGLLLLEIALSIPFPNVVPRLAFLPAPAPGSRPVECNNTETWQWERAGIVWREGPHFTTLVGCL